MKWIKIDRSQRIPEDNFLVTDGKNIAMKHNMSDRQRFLGEVTIQTATHYILLSDVPLPKKEKCKKCSEK